MTHEDYLVHTRQVHVEKAKYHARHHEELSRARETPAWKVPFHEAVARWMEAEVRRAKDLPLATWAKPQPDPWRAMTEEVAQTHPDVPFGKGVILMVNEGHLPS